MDEGSVTSRAEEELAFVCAEKLPTWLERKRICRGKLFAEADVIAYPLEVLIDRL
mgnify:CR=1 FL=1